MSRRPKAFRCRNSRTVTGEAGDYLNSLREYVTAQGIALEYDERIAPAQGMALNTPSASFPASEAEEFTTLVHELAHLMLQHAARRTAITKMVRETEAEAVAFVVGKSVGLNIEASADYINLYHGNAALLTESLEQVQSTAAVILAALKAEEVVWQEATDATTDAAAEQSSSATQTGARSRNQTATTEAA